MALHILEATRVNKARLHAFVVMSHHFHLIVKPNDSQTNSQFMRSLKSYSAKDLMPRLNAFEEGQLKQQSTLNQRKFWKASFRGFPIYSQKLSDQKMGYIHMNPARAGYVELPDD